MSDEVTDKTPVENMNARELLDELEGYEFRCQGGPLETATAWTRLKWMIEARAEEYALWNIETGDLLHVGSEALDMQLGMSKVGFVKTMACSERLAVECNFSWEQLQDPKNKELRLSLTAVSIRRRRTRSVVPKDPRATGRKEGD